MEFDCRKRNQSLRRQSGCTEWSDICNHVAYYRHGRCLGFAGDVRFAHHSAHQVGCCRQNGVALVQQPLTNRRTTLPLARRRDALIHCVSLASFECVLQVSVSHADRSAKARGHLAQVDCVCPANEVARAQTSRPGHVVHVRVRARSHACAW